MLGKLADIGGCLAVSFIASRVMVCVLLLAGQGQAGQEQAAADAGEAGRHRWVNVLLLQYASYYNGHGP
jgi:hypothetical protein